MKIQYNRWRNCHNVATQGAMRNRHRGIMLFLDTIPYIFSTGIHYSIALCAKQLCAIPQTHLQYIQTISKEGAAPNIWEGILIMLKLCAIFCLVTICPIHYSTHPTITNTQSTSFLHWILTCRTSRFFGYTFSTQQEIPPGKEMAQLSFIVMCFYGPLVLSHLLQ